MRCKDQASKGAGACRSNGAARLCLCVLWVCFATAAGVHAQGVEPDGDGGAGVAVETAGTTFDFEQLKREAEALAREPYQKPWRTLPEALSSLTYDEYRRILPRRERALWRDEGGGYQVLMYHLGSIFLDPVELWIVEEGRAEPVEFDPAMFEYLDDVVPLDRPAVARRMGAGLGFAGFRLTYPLNEPDKQDEIIGFLGSSYFRALGRGHIYGASARGLAIDTAIGGRPEEFPRFSKFWLVKPAGPGEPLVFFALLESPAVTGAYRFELIPPDPAPPAATQPASGTEGATRVRVSLSLYFRHGVSKLGIAPISSMYLHGEAGDMPVPDFRPEVHDSDGLLIHRRPSSKAGEAGLENATMLWRPLTNPPDTRVSRFEASDVVGFGLMQRDREFDHYQDVEAAYHRRPSLWVQPVGGWGQGELELVEFRTDNEMLDNITLYWVPRDAPQAGDRIELAYDLFFTDEAPGEDRVWRVAATRVDRVGGGRGVRRFLVDWAPPASRAASEPSDPMPVVEVEGANPDFYDLLDVRLHDNPYNGTWRMKVDVVDAPEAWSGLRGTLRFPDTPTAEEACETWIYPWRP